MTASGLTSDTAVRGAGTRARVDWINISNDGSGAGTAGQIIIEDADGTDRFLIPFASTQHQSLFISWPEPLYLESGLNVNFVTCTKTIVDIGYR